jgi:hypothetical protein
MADLVENLAPSAPPVVQSSNPTALIVETGPMLDGDIWGTRAPISVGITQVEQQKWTPCAFAILLNELDSTWDREGRIHSVIRQQLENDARGKLRSTTSPGGSSAIQRQCTIHSGFPPPTFPTMTITGTMMCGDTRKPIGVVVRVKKSYARISSRKDHQYRRDKLTIRIARILDVGNHMN